MDIKRRLTRLSALIDDNYKPNQEQILAEWMDFIALIAYEENYPKTFELMENIYFKDFANDKDLRRRLKEAIEYDERTHS